MHKKKIASDTLPEAMQKLFPNAEGYFVSCATNGIKAK